MLFNSLTFFIFFLLFFLGWGWVKNSTRPRLVYIVVASSIFYGWWDWRFLFLIALSGYIDFLAALLLERVRLQAWRRLILSVSLTCNLGMLGVFKYSRFIAESLDAGLRFVGIPFDLVQHIPPFCLILPVGISFFTFQSMSYTIDVYRGEIKATRSFVHFMAYLMMFPQLVAGPIVRARDFLYALLNVPVASDAVRYNGLKLIVVGFFKKCFLADNVAVYVNTAFANVNREDSSLTWWIVMVLFAIQIYCDFSGYSDIARGLARFMGYRFCLNFNHPYFAHSFRNFWTRWHISLSTWFRDYVYMPLGGSRSVSRPLLFGLRNTWIVFLLSGLWHGSAWTFVIWGAAHAFFLTLERVTCWPERLAKRRFGRLAGVGIVFVCTLLGWVFFRASSLGHAWYIIRTMLSFAPGTGKGLPGIVFLYIAIFYAMELFLVFRCDAKLCRRSKAYHRVGEAIALAGLAIITLMFRGGGNAFIYFQF
jgi:D-alanyl-lipoteichoic acid acyltransferase DltB (MBOAT superfamily)